MENITGQLSRAVEGKRVEEFEELVAVEAVVMKPAVKPAKRRFIRDYQVSEAGWPVMVIRLTEVREHDAPFSDVEVMWLGAVMGPNGEVEAPRWGKMEASSLPISGVDLLRVQQALEEAKELQASFEARARNNGLDKAPVAGKVSRVTKVARDLGLAQREKALEAAERRMLEKGNVLAARENAMKALADAATATGELYTLEQAWELIKGWREEIFAKYR